MYWVNGKDSITHQADVLLEGWVSRSLWREAGVNNVVVEFYQGEQILGEITTSEDGRFAFPFKHTHSGLNEVYARVKDQPSHLGRMLHLVNLNQELKKELIICDVDNTLARFSVFSFLLKHPLRELKGSAEVLNKLSENYYIVYLTHRDRRFSSLTKHWLRQKQFPAGPVFFWSMKEHPFSSHHYKSEALERIKKQSQLPLAMGFGDKTGDIAAYKKAGIPKVYWIKKNEDWQKILEVM